MKKKLNELDTSSSSSSMMPSTSQTTSTNPKGTIFVSTRDLKKPEVTKTIEKAKQNKVDIKIVEGNGDNKKLKYLSEILDEVTGDVSKPFTISGKNYQMVRALTPDRQKVTGVCSLDDVDEMGKNIIYSIEEFEEKIANKHLKENMPHDDEDDKSDVHPAGSSDWNKNDKMPSFEGFKHFIVNNKTGKARKFKSIEELAKAQMNEDEKYMSVKEFRKYVDETLFGSVKKNVVNEVGLTGSETDEDMNIKAQKLIKMINKRIPVAIIDQIKTNKIAQREVIAAFAEMVGVPRNGLAQLIAGLKKLAKTTTASTQQQTAQVQTEGKKIIKKVKIKNI
jgi:hypothetical protein